MKTANPAGEDVHVNISCSIDTAIAIGTQFGFPAKAFKLKVIARVHQESGMESASDPQFGGWFATVKSANLDGEGAVGIPPTLLKVGVGPFDTYAMAAESAAFAQLSHMKNNES